jgi:hypothetical protein
MAKFFHLSICGHVYVPFKSGRLCSASKCVCCCTLIQSVAHLSTNHRRSSPALLSRPVSPPSHKGSSVLLLPVQVGAGLDLPHQAPCASPALDSSATCELSALRELSLKNSGLRRILAMCNKKRSHHSLRSHVIDKDSLAKLETAIGYSTALEHFNAAFYAF